MGLSITTCESYAPYVGGATRFLVALAPCVFIWRSGSAVANKVSDPVHMKSILS